MKIRLQPIQYRRVAPSDADYFDILAYMAEPKENLDPQTVAFERRIAKLGLTAQQKTELRLMRKGNPRYDK